MDEVRTKVQDKQVLEVVLERLAVLTAEAEPADSIDPTYWDENRIDLSSPEGEEELINGLTALACNEEAAPDVAQGIVRNRFWGSELSIWERRLAEELLEKHTSKAKDCPGVLDISGDHIAFLREAANYQPPSAVARDPKP